MRMSFLFLALFSLTGLTWAADKPSVWIGDNTPGVKVKVNQNTKGVEVTLNKDNDHLPKSVGITFFDEKGNRTTLELKAMEPWTDPAKIPNPNMPQFVGALSSSNQSFTGFELSIPFGSDSKKIIRSQDLRKAE